MKGPGSNTLLDVMDIVKNNISYDISIERIINYIITLVIFV